MDFFNSVIMSNLSIWHLNVLDLAFIVLFFNIRERFSSSMTGVFIFHFLGTLLHELSHFLMALFLGAKPSFPFLLPKKDIDGSIVLGRVDVASSKWYSAFLISIAPLSLMGIAFLLQKYYFLYFGFSFLSVLFYFYLLIVLIDSSIPSSQDLRIAISGMNLLGGLMWIFIAFLLYENRAIFLNIRSLV